MSLPNDFIIQVQQLKQAFNGVEVLKGIDLDIQRAKTLVLLGGSGGGKSILLKHLAGLMKPLSGSIKIDGEEITHLQHRQMSPIRKKISIMFQGGALFDSMSVADNIAFPLRENKVFTELEIKRKVKETLDIVKLPNQENKMPADLSGGMRKRVALARAIINKPECVLYDEPHAGLDPITADAIDHLIKDLQLEHGITNVVITHEIRSVFHIADDIAFLKSGSILWQGDKEALQATNCRELQDFIQGNSGIPW